MKLIRQYFVSDDLDDIEQIEQELEAVGVQPPQIHVLTLDETEAKRHNHLHKVHSIMKKDAIHSGFFGAVLGLSAITLVLLFAYAAGWANSPAGWLPFIILAIVVLLGLFAWKGGLLDIYRINRDFERFEQELNAGKHVLFIDLKPEQKYILSNVVAQHPKAQEAGTGQPVPAWLLSSQLGLRRMLNMRT